MQSAHLRYRLHAAGIHLVASALVAACAALLVFGLWYPAPFAAIAGGSVLFGLLVSVDVIIGPLLTALVMNPEKSLRERTMDLCIVVALQLAAFIYGLHSTALARPVALVWEVDQFRVVSAADIDLGSASEAPPGMRHLSWRGPVLIATSKPADQQELLRTIELGLAGIPLAALPRHWQPYSAQVGEVIDKSRPVSDLLSKYPAATASVIRAAADAGQPVAALRFAPLRAPHAEWVTLIAAPDARVVGHLQLDAFF